jgi:diphthamide biosynthesis methyltransferase
MLYLVGLGLADETDITVKGLEVVKKADRVYLEAYTSILLVDKEKLVSLMKIEMWADIGMRSHVEGSLTAAIGSILW